MFCSLAARTGLPGGIITYADVFVSKRGVICPLFAALGSLLILYGSLMLPNYVDISIFGRSIHFKPVLIYFGIDALVMIISQIYYRPKKHTLGH